LWMKPPRLAPSMRLMASVSSKPLVSSTAVVAGGFAGVHHEVEDHLAPLLLLFRFFSSFLPFR
jgi:hypothetical protein